MIRTSHGMAVTCWGMDSVSVAVNNYTWTVAVPTHSLGAEYFGGTWGESLTIYRCEAPVSDMHVWIFGGSKLVVESSGRIFFCEAIAGALVRPWKADRETIVGALVCPWGAKRPTNSQWGHLLFATPICSFALGVLFPFNALIYIRVCFNSLARTAFVSAMIAKLAASSASSLPPLAVVAAIKILSR